MLDFLNALPGAISQGLIWGIMAIGVYLTYKILDIADLTVDGSFCTGGAVFVVLFSQGINLWVALLAATVSGMAAGLVTGLLHTVCGIPAILAGILTQLGLWSVNLAIMSMKANVALNIINPDVLNKLLVSLRFVQDVGRAPAPSTSTPSLWWVWSRWSSSRFCTGSSAPSWAAPSVPPAPTRPWPGPRASTPGATRCWA